MNYIGAAPDDAAIQVLASFVETNNKYASDKYTLTRLLNEIKNIDGNFMARFQDMLAIADLDAEKKFSIAAFATQNDYDALGKMLATTRFKGKWPTSYQDLQTFSDEVRRMTNSTLTTVPKSLAEAGTEIADTGKKYALWIILALGVYAAAQFYFTKRAITLRNPSRKRKYKKLSKFQRQIASENISKISKRQKRKHSKKKGRKQIIAIGLNMARKHQIELNPDSQNHKPVEGIFYTIGIEGLAIHDLMEQLHFATASEKPRIKEKIKHHEQKIEELFKKLETGKRHGRE